MVTKKEVQSKLTAKLKEILKFDTRIPAKADDIKNGDVSPFFLNLLGYEITLYGKVAQSVNTTFGMSFYEQVSAMLANSVGYAAETQYKLKGEVNESIGTYLNDLLENNDYVADRASELAKIKALTTPGKEVTNPDSTVDVFFRTPEGIEYYIDITTVKPNKKEFRTLKRKLLKWTAMRLSVNPDADVRVFIAIPYNPEAGKDSTNCEYNRFSSYYDRKDILVGNELWKLVSNNTFDINDMSEVFSNLGREATAEIRKELDKHLVVS